MSDHLAAAISSIGKPIAKDSVLADLPTPVGEVTACYRSLGQRLISIKYDDQTGRLYGGNKVRKLEYLLQRAS